MIGMILALWSLMKHLGLNDLRSRSYPKLTEFIAVDNLNLAIAISWPKTRLEGDYCHSSHGYVCQRPAASGGKIDSLGKYRFVFNS